MRCSRCGNENPTENRFCGMCGGTLLAAPAAAAVPETQTQRAASSVPAPIDPIPVEAPRPRVVASEQTSSISGPSFLGLNDPPPRKRASLKIDSHDAPHSGNLDYLLDDEHTPPPSGGVGKILVLLVVLLVAGGFFFMTWKNQGLSWLHSSNKPSAVAENPDGSADTPASTASPSNTPQAEAPAASPPASTAPASGGNVPDTSAKDAGASNTASDANPKDAATSSAAPSKDIKEADNSDDEDSPPAKEEKPAVAKKPAPAPVKHAKAEKPKPTVAKAAPKPAVAASNPADAVSQAKKYLYGRGESQDCDRGLKLLKPVANQGNSKAMIEMGALYSAGLCTPRDLPTSYRWFALALRKEPDNSSVQTDLQKLWGEMTQPERQLAIKLTQ